MTQPILKMSTYEKDVYPNQVRRMMRKGTVKHIKLFDLDGKFWRELDPKSQHNVNWLLYHSHIVTRMYMKYKRSFNVILTFYQHDNIIRYYIQLQENENEKEKRSN